MGTDGTGTIEVWVGAWVGLLVVAGFLNWRKYFRSVGLVLAYLLNISLLHLAGATVYLSKQPHLYPESVVTDGLRLSTLGLLGFTIGSIVVAPIFLSASRASAPREDYEAEQTLPMIYLLVGGFSYVALATFIGKLPTLNAITAVGQQVFLAGHCLLCWKAWKAGNRRRLTVLILIAALFPFITIVFQGFLTYGAFALALVLCFVASLVRSRLRILLAAGLTLYVGLSVFVTYTQERQELREVVWGGRTLSERLERLTGVFAEIEWFDPGDNVHQEQLDRRLNQNYLVGAAYRRLSANQEFADGDTITESFVALVPRAVWPSKPTSAGSGRVVTEYTGITFDPTTSVGIGHILEFYINFGTTGIVIGMLVFGAVLTILDVSAARHLVIGNWQGFVLRLLVGISFLQVGGSLAELTTSAAASVLLVVALNSLLYRLQRRRSITAVSDPSAGTLQPG